jgi:phage-related holin
MQWLVKIILYWVAMIVGNQIDLLIFHSTVEFWAKNLIILYIGINDAISILKHLSQAWMKLPQKLIDRLQGYQDSLDIDLSKTWEPLNKS